jgi:hypothetical protein
MLPGCSGKMGITRLPLQKLTPKEVQKMDNLRQSEHMLGKVYQSAAFGKMAAERVLPAVSDPRLSQELHRQKEGYTRVANTAEVYLGMTGKNPPMLSPLSGAMLEANLYAGLAGAKNDTRRIAQMVEKGNRTGLRKMRRLLDDSSDGACCGHELADRLYTMEQQNLMRIREL